MTILGDGVFLPPQRGAIEPPAEDALALRLELVLAALEGLRESLTSLPTPQVFIDAPDLSAIVNAVNGLKPGADAEEIAAAVVRTIAPTATPAETSDWQGQLIGALEKLDFRLKGFAGYGTSNANLPALLTSAPGADTGQAALPVRIISQLGASGGSSPTSVTINDPTITSQKLAIDAAGRITVIQSGTVAVTGTFWQTTQPVSLATNTPDVLDRAARLLGHVTVDSAPSTPVTGTFWPATQPVSATALPLPAGASQDGTDISSPTAMPAGGAGIRGWLSAIWTKLNGSLAVTGTFWQTTQPVSGTVAVSNFPGSAITTFKGRACTYRIPGRAGTTGQRLMTLMNAVGSSVTVTVNLVTIDTVMTVIKAVTVLPPMIRVYRITAVPAGGTAATKVARDSSLASNASVTALGDASADGTSSAVALTAVTTAGTMLTEEFAPRLITAAGYEMYDRTEFFDGHDVTLRAGEGIVVALDYTLATQNPTTDMWAVGIEWNEV